MTELKLLIMIEAAEQSGPEIFASEKKTEDVRRLHNRKQHASSN